MNIIKDLKSLLSKWRNFPEKVTTTENTNTNNMYCIIARLSVP